MNPVAELDKRELALLAIFIILKVALIFAMPLTGDEAYFTTWAANPALGYYDHPPMVGWGIHLLSLISDSYIFYRLFAFVTTLITALVIFRLAKNITYEKSARNVALLFFISPIALLMLLITNDIFLLLFGALGALYFYYAVKTSSKKQAIIAGILLGLCFLSKYFAVFLIFGLLIFALGKKNKAAIKVAIITCLVISPFILENLYYNYYHCWNNILFNFQSRVSTSGPSFVEPLVFIGTLLPLIPPQGIWMLFRSRFKITTPERSDIPKFVLLAAMPALLVFLIVSFKNRIGLHWLFLFVPFLYVLFAYLKPEKLKGLYFYNSTLSLIIGFGILTVTLFPKPILGKQKTYYQISLFTQTDNICQQLPRGGVIYSLDYTNNSMLSYFCKGNTYHVLFDVSKFGREDDKHVDIRKLDRETLTLFAMHPKDLKQISPYFDRIDVKEIQIKDNPNYYLVTGYNFNYQKYRKDILATIAREYYNVPAWLPVGHCGFKEKYSL